MADDVFDRSDTWWTLPSTDFLHSSPTITVLGSLNDYSSQSTVYTRTQHHDHPARIS